MTQIQETKPDDSIKLLLDTLAKLPRKKDDNDIVYSWPALLKAFWDDHGKDYSMLKIEKAVQTLVNLGKERKYNFGDLGLQKLYVCHSDQFHFTTAYNIIGNPELKPKFH